MGNNIREDIADADEMPLAEQVERRYFPERFPFLPFGDPHEGKRAHDAKKDRQRERQQAALGEQSKRQQAALGEQSTSEL